mmetsp:Transcript_7713/g.23349  ORF Transcript_7713/g.23349 Transcript_7713/m.23349 type:complete len:204 (+) Transcript_7713:3576-4187(+)
MFLSAGFCSSGGIGQTMNVGEIYLPLTIVSNEFWRLIYLQSRFCSFVKFSPYTSIVIVSGRTRISVGEGSTNPSSVSADSSSSDDTSSTAGSWLSSTSSTLILRSSSPPSLSSSPLLSLSPSLSAPPSPSLSESSPSLSASSSPLSALSSPLSASSSPLSASPPSLSALKPYALPFSDDSSPCCGVLSSSGRWASLLTNISSS